MAEATASTVQIELPADLLRTLLQNSALCPAQIRCLNLDSRQQVQRLLSDSLKTQPL